MDWPAMRIACDFKCGRASRKACETITAAPAPSEVFGSRSQRSIFRTFWFRRGAAGAVQRRFFTPHRSGRKAGVDLAYGAALELGQGEMDHRRVLNLLEAVRLTELCVRVVLRVYVGDPPDLSEVTGFSSVSTPSVSSVRSANQDWRLGRS